MFPICVRKNPSVCSGLIPTALARLILATTARNYDFDLWCLHILEFQNYGIKTLYTRKWIFILFNCQTLWSNYVGFILVYVVYGINSVFLYIGSLLRETVKCTSHTVLCSHHVPIKQQSLARNNLIMLDF